MLQPMKLVSDTKQLGGGVLPTLYAVLTWEALFSAFTKPASLPFLRAALAHRLHHAATKEPHKLGSDTAIKLSDALFYLSFTLFPAGFMKDIRICRESIVPFMTLFAAMWGSNVGKQEQKERLKAEKEAQEALEAQAETAKSA